MPDADHDRAVTAISRPNPWIRHAPNALTAFRLLLAALLPAAPPDGRLPIVLIAGATDFLDGAIARRFGATSALGGILDASADKLFTLSAIITLAFASEIVWWQAVIALTRDAAVALAVLVAIARHRWSAFRERAPSRFGKWTTAFLYLWFAVALVPAPAWAEWSAFALLGVFSLSAGMDYLRALRAAIAPAGP